jgi:hypothetical protein
MPLCFSFFIAWSVSPSAIPNKFIFLDSSKSKDLFITEISALAAGPRPCNGAQPASLLRNPATAGAEPA